MPRSPRNEVEEVNTETVQLRAKVQLKVDGVKVAAGVKFIPSQETYDALTARDDFDEIAAYVDVQDDEELIDLTDDGSEGDEGSGL